jgi:hypothetical protein
MKPRPSWWRRGFTLSLFVGGLLACGIREDEFDCENAVARLVQCCPGFVASSVDCTYSPGCNDNPYPSLDPSQSNCIMQSSCDTLRQTGVCDAASNLAQGSQTPVTSQSVCPPAGSGAAPDAATATNPLGCTSAGDCPGGQVCCYVAPSGGSLFGSGAACADAPCPSAQLCATAAECSPGLSCTPLWDPAIRLCEPGDAGADAASESEPGEADGIEGGDPDAAGDR